MRTRLIFLPVSFVIPLVCFTFAAGGHAQKSEAQAKTASAISVPPRSNVDLLAEIKKRGKLRVGIYETVPWTMHNKDGEWIGFEIDVAKRMASDMGVQVEFYPDQFRYLIPDLLTGRFDIIMAGFSINAERALQMDFSNAYNVTDVELATNTKLGANPKTLQDFNNPGSSVGVIEGATSEDLVKLALPKASVRTYNDDHLLFGDLLQGKLTAAVGDGPRLEILAKLYPGAVTLADFPPLGTFPASFAVQRGNLDFVNYLNSWIAARNADMWLDTRRAYWFNSTDWAKNL